MKPREKVFILDKVLEMARKNQLSNEQRNILFEIINNSNKTEKQKERFTKYYNLDIKHKQNYNYSTLAKELGCSPSSIPASFYGVRELLKKDENIELLRKILEA